MKAKGLFHRVPGAFSNVVTVSALLAIWTPGPSFAQSTFTWNGGGADNNWNTGGNWGGTAPTTPQANLHFAGTTRPINTNNLGSFASGFRIFLDSGASAFTLRGNEIKFFDF